ncbi:cutinase family protein [Intrasporangium mesophilum]
MSGALNEPDPKKILKGIGLRYTAMHVPVWENAAGPVNPLLGMNAAFADVSYNASIWMGVDRIQQYLEGEIGRCGTSQQYVLVGYSQGALAIHIYLERRATNAVLDQIAAVGLIADPAKNGHGAESVFTDGFKTAEPGMWNATGVYRKALLPGSGPLPDSITPYTASLCHNNDIVCAPGWGSGWWNHDYWNKADEIDQLAEWLASTALASHR